MYGAQQACAWSAIGAVIGLEADFESREIEAPEQRRFNRKSTGRLPGSEKHISLLKR
jgi:hypothetical protein